MKLSKLCALAVIVLLLPLSATADPLSYITGTYQQVAYAQGVGGASLIGGFGPSPTVNIDTPHYHDQRDPFSFYTTTATADSYLKADLSAGSFHAYAATAASIANYDAGTAPGAFARGYADLRVNAFDLLQFSSLTLASGTDVTFELTATLHSVLDVSYVPGNCPSPANATYAALNVNTLFAPGTLFHSSCGDGSELMTATAILHTTVGSNFGLSTTFQLQADSGVEGEFYRARGLTGGTAHTTVDASNTGSVYIKILTTGVTLTSDSGATYAAPAASVPEPTSLVLLIPALGGIGLLRRRLANTN